MEQTAQTQGRPVVAGSLPGLASFNHLFQYLFCMLASTAILSRPILGGALYMIGQVTVLFSKLLMPGDFFHLPRRLRVTGIILAALSALFALGVLLIYPLAVELPLVWLVFALACLLIVMSEWTKLIVMGGQRRGLHWVRRMVRVVEMMLFTCGVAALILFFSQPAQTAWYLLGGYALCCLFRLITLLPRREEIIPPREEGAWQLMEEGHQLAQVNAYRVFRSVMLITIIALQVTMIMIFTFIGTTANSLFSSLLIAFVCAVVAQWLTELLLRRPLFMHRMAPSSTLIYGLMLWLLSLASFVLRTLSGNLVFSYLSLALCTSGVTMSGRALQTLERDMRDVVHFAMGEKQDKALDSAHAALSEYAAMIGRMIALLALTLITLISGGTITPTSVSVSVQPLLLLPAAALVLAAIPVAFRLPIDKQVVEKTRTFLRLQENGETNIPLQKQLEDLVVKVHKRRYGIKLIILILRPFFYSKVIGANTVTPERDVSIIFTCNHGEMWGPVVTNLFIPFSFRPWVINEIAVPEDSSTYLYNNTIKRQRWIPERLKWPATRLTTAFLIWIMESLNSIPVYRDDPYALIKTFRETAVAMEAGDNILIFPENPNHETLPQPGYVKEGVGPFFSGFAMVGQIYYQRTGKCAQFYPIYADKKNHTLTFGQMTRWNPDNDGDEKERIARHLRREMLRMGGLPDEEDAGI